MSWVCQGCLNNCSVAVSPAWGRSASRTTSFHPLWRVPQHSPGPVPRITAVDKPVATTFPIGPIELIASGCLLVESIVQIDPGVAVFAVGPSKAVAQALATAGKMAALAESNNSVP